MTTSLRVIFAGTPDFAACHLSALIDSAHTLVAVLTQPDRHSGRGKKMRPSPVKKIAIDHGLQVLQPRTLNDADIQAQLASFQADIMVVVAYGLLLPQAVLDIPRFGCLNVHGSLLPRWRGAAPIQRAVEAGDTESGVTIMQMEAGLDTGPMLAKAVLKLTPNETAGSLHDRLAVLGTAALIKTLDFIEGALANAEVQDDALANYAHKIQKTELNLNFNEPAEVLARRIRAFSPTPGCFALLNGERVKLLQAHAIEGEQHPVGHVVAVEKSGWVIATGRGHLAVTQAQFPGARPMSIEVLMNGRASQMGVGNRLLSQPLVDSGTQ